MLQTVLLHYYFFSWNILYSDKSYYDEKKHDWATDAGKYVIQVGSSSRDIRAAQSISL